MTTDPSQPAKPRFYDVCLMHELDYLIFEEIAKQAAVGKAIVERMFIQEMVRREDAKKVLAVVSERLKRVFTFENTRVAIFPLFSEIVEKHKLDHVKLSKMSGVNITVIDMILANEPVAIDSARSVLRIVSQLSGQIYTVFNVDMATEEGGESHE